MKYYFENAEKQQELKKILDSWLNTPFRHRAASKGLGVDCIHFVAKILEELGILEWKKNLVPEYASDWHLHKTQSLLVEGILQHLNVENVGFNKLINGDLIIYHFGKAASHASIYYDDHTYQAVNDIGVIKINFADKMWNRRKRFNFRILA